MSRPKKEKPNHAGDLYEIKITVGHNPDGSLIRKSFYSDISKDDARSKSEEYKIEQETANRTGVGFISKDITFGQWVNKWLESYKKASVKSSTYEDTYKRVVDKYLIPMFGKMLLRDIKPVHIKNFYADNSKKYYKTTLSKMRLCLRGIFDAAIDNDLCSKNPAKNVAITVINKSPEKHVYSQSENDIVIAFAKEHNYGILIMLMLVMGLRRSEVVGLRWGDINFKEKALTVNQAVIECNGKVIVGDPKTKKSHRTLPLSDDFLKYLSDIRGSAKYPGEEHYIVAGQDGGIMAPINVVHRRYNPFMKDLAEKFPEIPILTPHEMRHTCGTLLYQKTRNIYAVSKFLGYSDLATTVKIYVHDDVETLRKDLNIK